MQTHSTSHIGSDNSETPGERFMRQFDLLGKHGLVFDHAEMEHAKFVMPDTLDFYYIPSSMHSMETLLEGLRQECGAKQVIATLERPITDIDPSLPHTGYFVVGYNEALPRAKRSANQSMSTYAVTAHELAIRLLHGPMQLARKRFAAAGSCINRGQDKGLHVPMFSLVADGLPTVTLMSRPRPNLTPVDAIVLDSVHWDQHLSDTAFPTCTRRVVVHDRTH